MGTTESTLSSTSQPADQITTVSERSEGVDPILERLKSLKITTPILTSPPVESNLTDILVRKPSTSSSVPGFSQDLKPVISYLLPRELELVHSALKLAFDAHDGQKQRSGEPFIIHPVEVARILGELELDWESIAAGLMHDTVEDTNVVTFERLEKEFGATVRHIVEGETKVDNICDDQ